VTRSTDRGGEPVPGMRTPAINDVTHILSAIEQGDPVASEQLMPLVYEELRRLAAQRLANEPMGQTLQATALVHEAYVRLVKGSDPGWNGRGHFFAAAAEAMRRILVERARRRNAPRGGGGWRRVDLADVEAADPPASEDLLALNEALDRLAVEDPNAARLVSLRYFAGLSMAEAASALGVSLRTAERNWSYARAWLHKEIAPGDQD
jgi:RNA polymerase sigma factor (TIGR02999 family)